jgi:hypothetical protein
MGQELARSALAANTEKRGASMNTCRNLAITADVFYALVVLCFVVMITCAIVAMACAAGALVAVVIMALFPVIAPICLGFIWFFFIGFAENVAIAFCAVLLMLLFWFLTGVVNSIRTSLGCP